MSARSAMPRRRFDVKNYQRGVGAFLAERGEARLATFTGRGGVAGEAALYARHGHLFEDAGIDALAGRARRDGPETRALHAFAVEGRLAQQVAPLTDRIARAEQQAVVVWRGERIGYHSLPARIAETGDRGERNALHGAFEEAVEAINRLREERYRGLRQVAIELGYADYADCVARVRGIDLAALGEELRAFVAESETVYFAALRRYVAQIDIEQGDATLADAGHLFRAGSWDPWFPVADAMRAARATLAGLGIDLERQENVTLEQLPAERHAAGRAALAIGVRVPGDVRLAFRPASGHRSWSELLHAIGHLQQLAHAVGPLVIEVDPGLAEGWGFLADGLLLEPEWLMERTRMDESSAIAFSDFAAFRRLYALRLEAARLLYELRLHRTGDLRLARAYYAGLLSNLTGLIHPPARYLADAADPFDSAAYLRGWMIAASVADGLRLRSGAAWWRMSPAGAWLADAWAGRTGTNGEDVVAKLGYDLLDWRPVLRQIRTHLVGEMSGYGGPNITTRAGTRKV